MPINKTVALVGGITMAVLGVAIMLLGMLEFRSFKRMSGMDSSRLITSGIYRYLLCFYHFLGSRSMLSKSSVEERVFFFGSLG